MFGYRQRQLCFAWIEDGERAQQLLNEQLRTAWPGLLNRLLEQANPALRIVDPSQPTPYYGSLDEGELYTKPSSDDTEERRRSAAISRTLRLLRAQGLIHEIPKTHRCQLSPPGRDMINAVLAARQASTAKLAA